MEPIRFDDLCAAVAACRRCPRMEGRRRVLSRLNGPVPDRSGGSAGVPDAARDRGPGAVAVLFVAEAPGRLGGDRTGVPLTTDRTGRNFSALLAGIGWPRDRVFVTNAVLCNPRDPAGRNDRPSLTEIANCNGWLQAQIETVDPTSVVSLGAVALAALGRIEPHGLRLRESVARPFPWLGRTLIPLYHPGAQAQMTRPAARQREDWAALRDLVRPLPGPVVEMPAIAPPAQAW